MSGHSKWTNIKRKKEATDAAKAKIFTKIGREITVCVKEGGADPSSNAKLRDLIAKAKSNNVPNDNIERVIKKAAGGGDKNNYESIVYEGYGPNGVAVIVDVLTDNRHRPTAAMKHAFDKFGGNLGQSGCVGFMFADRGVIAISNEDGDVDADKLMEDALEAGASDFTDDGDVLEIQTEPDDLSAVRDALAAKGYEFISAEIEKVPSSYIKLENEEDIRYMNLLLEHLDDNEDVQNVWHNWEE